MALAKLGVMGKVVIFGRDEGGEDTCWPFPPAWVISVQGKVHLLPFRKGSKVFGIAVCLACLHFGISIPRSHSFQRGFDNSRSIFL